MSADKFILYNLEDLSTICFLAKNSKRVKYSCFDASDKWLIFGATSGSLYVYSRDTCAFIKIIPSKLASISQVKISGQERLVVFSNLKGQVAVVDLTNAESLVNMGQLDKGYVTCFFWETEEKLYCGDQIGNVSLLSLGYFMGRNIVNITLRTVVMLDSPIVQIAGQKDLLLISTYAKCMLGFSEMEEFKQIGERPRDGEYGACFHSVTDDFGTISRIYCARPGCRMWECDMDGRIKFTHQFKGSLSMPPSYPLANLDTSIKLTTKFQPKSTELSPSNTFHFAKLINFMEKFVITYSDSKLFVIDPTGRILLWTNYFNNIQTVCVLRSKIIIFTSVSTIFTIECATLQDYVLKQFQFGLYLDCAESLKANLDYFSNLIKKKHEFIQLYKLKQILEDLNQKQKAKDLQKFFDEIFVHSHDMVQTSLGHGNGIYILDNQYSNRHRKIIEKSGETTQSTAGLKDVLASAYDAYGKNFKEMFKGLKTLNLDTGYLYGDHKSTSSIKEVDPTNVEPDKDVTVEDTEGSSKVQEKTPSILTYSISEEEKLVRSLYLIYKSSKISNLNFLDRYSMLFDRYDTQKIIELLKQLEQVMIENDDGDEIEARKDCIKMYFDYLNPEIIYELDENCLNFIKDSFVLINEPTEAILRCNSCQFPIRPVNTLCRYPKIGNELLKYYWSRHGYESCFEIAHNVPSTILETLCKFFIQEKNVEKVVNYILNLANEELLLKAADHFSISAWRRTFDVFCLLLLDQKISCLKCDELNLVPENFYNTNLFYTFNHIFATASNYLNGRIILDLLHSYSDKISNGTLNKDIYLNCLINS